MAEDDYQANWRGARRHQFDEEARRKSSALLKDDEVVAFRRVKWADPEQKLKVLIEDLSQPIAREAWLVRMPAKFYSLLVVAASASVFVLVVVTARLLT